MDLSDAPPALARRAILASTVMLDTSMVLSAVGLGWWLDLRWWDDLGMSLYSGAVGAVAGLVLIASVWAFVHTEGPPESLRRAFVADLQEVFETLSPLRDGDLVLISLGAGLAEEAVFRGLVEAAGDAWLGQGALIAAVGFGLVHPISRVYVAYAAAVGLALSGVMAIGGGLFAAMVAHAVYDIVALVAGMRSPLIRPSRDGLPSEP